MPGPPPDLDTARVKYWVWKSLVIVIFGAFIYAKLVAEGLRVLFPTLGKGTVLGFDTPTVLALVLMVAVCTSWELALAATMKMGEFFLRFPPNFKGIVITLAGALIIVDAYLMYSGLVRMNLFRGAAFSWTAFMGTVALTAVMIFACLVSVCLKRPLLEK